MTSGFFSVLLRDTATLLRPLPVAPLRAPDSAGIFSGKFDHAVHPHRTSILVLSDLSKLFGTKPHPSKTKPNHITHKLLFYIAHILSTQSILLRAVSEEVMAKSLAMEKDTHLVTSRSEWMSAPSQLKVDIVEEI
jgi:hypothetical protein